MAGYTPAPEIVGMVPEDLSYVLGIDQSRSEKHLLQYTRRRVYAYTDDSDGITYRLGSIQTDGLGFGRLPFTPSVSGNINGSRGLGIFQSPFASAPTWENVFAMFSTFSGSNQVQSLDNWQMANSGTVYGGASNITSYNAGTSPTPGLLCHETLNGYDILADQDRFYRFTPGSTNVYAPVLVQPATPTIGSTSAGILNGYYAYCITLVDANNNESLPSALVATTSLSAKQVVISVTLATGLDTVAKGWTTMRLYRTQSGQQATAQTALNGSAFSNQGTFTVVSTTGFPSPSGTFSITGTITEASGQVLPLNATVNYTNTTATTFTGCTTNVQFGVINSGAIVATTTGPTAITAATNPVFYHVPGLDVTLVPGTNTYSFGSDNNDDAAITATTSSYPLALGGLTSTGSPITYFNGVLQTMPTAAVPSYISSWNNRILGANWFNINSVNYPNRVYWCDLQDSSLSSTGNATGWNALSFLDFDNKDGSQIIGMYPGLQGLFYVFKTNGTIVLQATGNPTTPFLPTKIDAEYGMYNFSVAEVGSTVIGRTKDGIATFNGTSYKIISHPIVEFLKTCIYPEGDSGVYDFATQRYYLAVCTTTVPGTWDMLDPNNNQNLIYAARNAVIVYDVATQTWEIHKNIPIQKFIKLKDNFKREKVFGIGVSSDIFAIVQGELYGSCFSMLASRNSPTQFTTTAITLPQAFVGKKLHVVCFYSENSIFSWSNYVTYITAISGSTVTVNDTLPFAGDSTDKFLIMIDNGAGTITGQSSNTLVDTNNYFQQQINGYFLYVQSNNAPAGSYSTNTGEVFSNSTTLAPFTGTWSLATGTQYQLQPYKIFSTLSLTNSPVMYYKTPPFGELQGSAFKKIFRKIYVQIKGSGTLIVNTYVDGRSAIDQTLYLTIPSATNFTQKFLDLQGSVGNYMRVSFGMIRGTGWFIINEFGARYRKVGSYRNA